MSVATSLLDNTIEPDEIEQPTGTIGSAKPTRSQPVVLTPTSRMEQMATTDSDAEAGMS